MSKLPLALIATLMLSAAALATPAASTKPAAPEARSIPELRLYTLDCGRIDFTDMSNFSDTGDHDGERGAMPVPCFLIRHGGDWMLWDAGLGDEIAASAAGRIIAGLHFRVPRTLASQLDELKLKPDDIRYVALSHLHADHSGNVALFPHATFLVSPLDVAWARGMPTPEGVAADRVAAVVSSRVEPVVSEKDVFGDGTVRMIATPGHTVGHHSLMVKLRKSGWVILSGDVAHFKVNYDRNLVPLGNASRAETIASIARIKGLAAHFHARVIIQHSADIFTAMPKSPAWLD